MKNNLLSEHLSYNGDNNTRTHVHLLTYSADHFHESVHTDFNRIVSELPTDKCVWIRVHGLQDTEYIKNICNLFKVNFLMMQDILNVDHPSKMEKNGDYNFVVARIFHEGNTVPIRLIQGKNFVLSFTEGEAPFFDDAARALKENILKIRTRTPDYLLSVLINELDSELINEANRPFFNDVYDHLLNAVQLTESCRETISSLMDLYISNSDMRMNYIMKRLTIVSTIFIPLTFLVGVWGMNFKYMPELEWEHGYLAAWIVMLVTGAVAYFILQTRKWK